MLIFSKEGKEEKSIASWGCGYKIHQFTILYTGDPVMIAMTMILQQLATPGSEIKHNNQPCPKVTLLYLKYFQNITSKIKKVGNLDLFVK